MGSEALIIISDDEEDAHSEPLKQKKRSLHIQEDVDVILIEEESVEHREENCVASDDDCCIINCDAENMRVPEHQVNDGDDLVVVGERGPVACRDYPHARHFCVKFPFKSTSHETHCEQCHCYVCDVLAPCLLWGQGKQKTDHCHAFDKDETWRKMRNRARSPPAKLKFVIRPQVTQSPPYMPNYQNGYHSLSDPWGSNVTIFPAHTRSLHHGRTRSQPIALRPTSGLHLGSDFVCAPNRMQRHSQCNIAVPNQLVGMINISRRMQQPFLHRGTDIRTNTHEHDMGFEDLVPGDATVIQHTFSPAPVSSSAPILQEFLHADASKQSQEQPMVNGLNTIDPHLMQMDEVNSGLRPILESVERTSSFSQHIETVEPGTNEVILPNNDFTTSVQTCHIVNGETMETRCSSMNMPTINTGNLMTSDLCLRIFEEIFGNEQSQNLWEPLG